MPPESSPPPARDATPHVADPLPPRAPVVRVAGHAHAPMRSLAGATLPSLAPSGRLRFAAGYFKLTGGLLLVGSVTLLAMTLGIVGPRHAGGPPPWAFAFAALQGAGNLWIGRLLARRRRAGGQMALATLLLPILVTLPDILRGRPDGPFTLALTALGCALVASVWRELGDDD